MITWDSNPGPYDYESDAWLDCVTAMIETIDRFTHIEVKGIDEKMGSRPFGEKMFKRTYNKNTVKKL